MITFHNVTKRYGDLTALDAACFTVQAGSVTGFLGPNGAGKSTAMRILLGLTAATSGRATVLDQPYAELPNPAYQVGSLLDAGALHPGRTGQETLTCASMMLGRPRSRVAEVLDLVGLSRVEGRKRLGSYSLGMRQRLGIAQALLGEPQVLVLDEPANGLDPQGIRWLRGLLSSLAAEGCAVLLSSHLLHEVEQVADQIVMIGGGRILTCGTPAELSRDQSLEQTFFELTTLTDRSAA